MEARKLAMNNKNQSLFVPLEGRTPRDKRDLFILASAIDQLLAGREAQAEDILAQHFRAMEASLTEEGGWTVARHLEVLPDSQVNAIEQPPCSYDGRRERRTEAPTEVEGRPAKETGVGRKPALGNRRSGSRRRTTRRKGKRRWSADLRSSIKSYLGRWVRYRLHELRGSTVVVTLPAGHAVARRSPSRSIPPTS